ncbi:hypothetical protein Egran_03356 [Elaphomyces granulatus]|uniref:Mitochondrial distribution and morphology protein 10 n=1 Tax=Elaphomyces granulatus TaxID=519963 RepID=A0A232LXX3_9EURO|nr:hypothetical protein Egran_03356 [Elaphomyces granulatus]
MLDFMDYVQLAFSEATSWNRDNSYTALTATAQSLLDFHVPERLQVHLSSLSTPHFATAYTLGTVGLIDGSLSYLFSTIPLDGTPSKSALIPLRKFVLGYRQLEAPIAPFRDNGQLTSGKHDAFARQKASLLHATFHLPSPTTLTAMFLRRLSPTAQVSLALSSTQGPPLIKSAPQASILAQLSHDTGKYCNEYLFSTDNALFGWRGLWNFGPDPRQQRDYKSPPRLSLLSAGGEAYYSPVSSVVGLSTGLRFTTLPAATEGVHSSPNHPSPVSTFPYTLTLTLTPLTGSLSTTYSLHASQNLAFSSRFGFNVYSWESEIVVGGELWRKARRAIPPPQDDVLEWARRKMGLVNNPRALASSVPLAANASPTFPADTGRDAHDVPTFPAGQEQNESVIKVRIDQSGNVRLLWEGRIKELLITAGVAVGPGSFSSMSSRPSSPSYPSGGHSAGGGSSGSSYWRGVGVSILYSS